MKRAALACGLASLVTLSGMAQELQTAEPYIADIGTWTLIEAPGYTLDDSEYAEPFDLSSGNLTTLRDTKTNLHDYVSFGAGCNSHSAGEIVEGKNASQNAQGLPRRHMLSTLLACMEQVERADGEMQQLASRSSTLESVIVGAYYARDRQTYENGVLTWFDDKGEMVAKFAAKPALSHSVWSIDGRVHNAPNEAFTGRWGDVALGFSETEFEVLGVCGLMSGGYALDGQSLSISEVEATPPGAACTEYIVEDGVLKTEPAPSVEAYKLIENALRTATSIDIIYGDQPFRERATLRLLDDEGAAILTLIQGAAVSKDYEGNLKVPNYLADTEWTPANLAETFETHQQFWLAPSIDFPKFTESFDFNSVCLEEYSKYTLDNQRFSANVHLFNVCKPGDAKFRLDEPAILAAVQQAELAIRQGDTLYLAKTDGEIIYEFARVLTMDEWKETGRPLR